MIEAGTFGAYHPAAGCVLPNTCVLLTHWMADLMFGGEGRGWLSPPSAEGTLVNELFRSGFRKAAKAGHMSTLLFRGFLPASRSSFPEGLPTESFLPLAQHIMTQLEERRRPRCWSLFPRNRPQAS